MNKTVLQIELSCAKATDAGENVIFDKIVYLENCIHYDLNTGTFTICQPGQYTVNWWATFQPSVKDHRAILVLTPYGTGQIHTASRIREDEIFGVDSILVTNPPVTLSLVNAGGEPLVYPSSAPLKAALSVTIDCD